MSRSLTSVLQRDAVCGSQRRIHRVVQPVRAPLDAGAAFQGGPKVSAARSRRNHILCKSMMYEQI